MDYPSYYSTKTAKPYHLHGKKYALVKWLISKGIGVPRTLLKAKFLQYVKQYTVANPISYVIDEIVGETGRIVLRLRLIIGT